jgi:hypothetical protein
MEILFNEEKEIVLRPAETKTINKLTIERVVDFPTEKKVVAHTNDLYNPIVLWSGDEYTAIGQWTDSDVLAKLEELFA